MNKPTNLASTAEELLIPQAIIEKLVMEGATPARAWREYLGLSQETMADKLGIPLPEYIAEEARHDLLALHRARIAGALCIDAELLTL